MSAHTLTTIPRTAQKYNQLYYFGQVIANVIASVQRSNFHVSAVWNLRINYKIIITQFSLC